MPASGREGVAPSLAKTPTGSDGRDQVTVGGLPPGRATLVCGGPGWGKTLLGISLLVNGARRFGLDQLVRDGLIIVVD